MNNDSKKFLSCDWGTTAFRLRLVDRNDLSIMASLNTPDGITQMHKRWVEAGHSADEKVSFYKNHLREQVRNLQQQSPIDLENVPLIISGMVSSNIGMKELPYKKFPFRVDGSDLLKEFIPADDKFENDIILISGASTSDDVMRGEETQLVGAATTDKKCLYIFPGTHSKHIITENNLAVDCRTFMTGEFFDLLSSKSILSASVKKGNWLAETVNQKVFESGVEDGLRKNILNASFKARTNTLFGKLSPEENYYYLSGVVIGTELKDLGRPDFQNITMVANREQLMYYESALNVVGKFDSLRFTNAEKATVRGQHLILMIGK